MLARQFDAAVDELRDVLQGISWLAILDKLLKAKAHVSPVALSFIYIGLGDTSRALDCLERGWTSTIT